MDGLDEALTPKGLGPRGAALWQAMGGDATTDAARAVLLVEAARLADQLDLLDRVVGGDASALPLDVRGALAERRQSVTVLRQTIAQLREIDAADKVDPAKPRDRPGLDELERRRAERRSAAADL